MIHHRKYAFILLYWLTVVSSLAAVAQTGSNKGTEFWTAFPSHESDVDANFNPLPANFSVFLTSDRASSGVITAGSFTQNFTVTANEVTEIKIPRDAAYIDKTESNQILSNRAIHVLVDDGQPPIVMYAHIFAGQRSAASLILPKEALGQHYYSINYQQQNQEGQNFILAIATEPHTRFHIKRGNTELVPGGILLDKVNDVYEYLSDEDLTGVSVIVDETTACNRFALFSGSTGVSIGRTSCRPNSLDPLFQQNYPVQSWGLSYGFIPFSMKSPHFTQAVRTAGQLARIVAQDAATHVTINGNTVATLNAGEYYTTPEPLTDAAVISADKPICVAQYALSQYCANTTTPAGIQPENYSDPDMVILNPIALNINNITLYSSTRENITEQYINILMKTQASASFKINGSAPGVSFTALKSLPGYAYLQLNLNNFATNTFTLTADEGFNAIAYGFGNVESYSYSAGTNLVLSEKLSGIKTATQLLADSACVNEDFSFKLTVPYQAASISWQMDPAENPVLQTAPPAKIDIVDNQVVYNYSFPRTAAYQLAGVHHCEVIVAYPQNGNCNAGTQRIEYDFLVDPAPAADFEAQVPDCPNTVNFKDRTNLNGVKTVSWHWDFDDPGNAPVDSILALQNPTHTFSKSGTYKVSLTVTTASGCQTYKSATITINQSLPVLAFDSLESVCLNTSAFKISSAKELSGSAGNGVYSGDGILADGSFEALKAGIGKHLITYTYTNPGGCSVSASRNIQVLSTPSVTNSAATLYYGESMVLHPIYSGTDLTYDWSPATGLNDPHAAYPTASPISTTLYTVTVSNGVCAYTANINVEVIRLPRAPNTFTPNGDGVNDFWDIEYIQDYPNAAISVFNRYGGRVFFSKGLYKPWDGKYEFVPVPWGVYYYIIDFDRRRKPLTGSLTIIR